MTSVFKSPRLPGMRLDDMRENAAYAAIQRIARKKTRERLLMVLASLLPWFFGGWYMMSMRGFSPALCAMTGLQAALTILMVLACVFFFGGIEGYEASIALKPFSLDLWMAGIKSEDLGAAIVAHGAGRYSARMLIAAALVVASVIGAVVVVMPPRIGNLTIWLASEGFFPVFVFVIGIRRQETFLVRNSLMWIGLVRRNYESEYTELSLPGERRATRILRSIRAITVACILVIGMAGLSFYAFRLLDRVRFADGPTFGIAALMVHAVAGWLVGLALCYLTGRQSVARFQQLGDEILLLTRYRAELKKER